ncbi:hypothetical protein Tco_0197011, partial [Tanacetum coccineum]
DFVILDMIKDFRMPIILRRPLLATAHAKIDVFRKLISLELGNENIVFKIKDKFNETLTPIESLCALRNVESESHEEIDYIWSMIDQGEPRDIDAIKEPSRNKRRDIDHLSVAKPKVHWCEGIQQLKGDEHDFWASCNPYDDQCDEGDVPDNTEKKCYWICMNDDKRLDVA